MVINVITLKVMLKYFFIAAIATLLLSCNLRSSRPSLADSLHTADTSLRSLVPDRLIVPGKSVGPVQINKNAGSAIAKLGKPDLSDAAMGASLMTWMVKHGKNTGKIMVYAHRNLSGTDEQINYIREIRVTSLWYKTSDYAGPGSELKDVKKVYKLKKRAARDKKLWVYDDVNRGIAFEVDSTGRCISVLVHAPQDSSGTYLSMQ